MFRKRYTVVIVGDSGSSAAQRSEVSQHRSERDALLAAQYERERLGSLHGDGTGKYRVVVEREGEVISTGPGRRSERVAARDHPGRAGRRAGADAPGVVHRPRPDPPGHPQRRQRARSGGRRRRARDRVRVRSGPAADRPCRRRDGGPGRSAPREPRMTRSPRDRCRRTSCAASRKRSSASRSASPRGSRASSSAARPAMPGRTHRARADAAPRVAARRRCRGCRRR